MGYEKQIKDEFKEASKKGLEKTKVVVIGAGRMGSLIHDMAQSDEENFISLGTVEALKGETIHQICWQKCQEPDILIDFSNPENLDMILQYAMSKKCGVVIATTGYTPEQEIKIAELAKEVPVIKSANFSLGITVMKHVLEDIIPVLKEAFDIEVLEKHHNKKADSPSGTAKMLVDVIDRTGDFDKKYGRVGIGLRGKEIGIHAIRGGTIVGEHTVMFAGEDEIIEIKHVATSKRIFAIGALEAARFLHQKKVEGKAGMYSVDEVLFYDDINC